MNLSILTILIFVVSLVLLLCALYFIVEAPAAKKKLRERILSAQDVAGLEASPSAETQILRAEVLSNVPVLNRILLEMPGVEKLSLFIQQSAVEISVGMLLFFAALLTWFTFLACLVAGLPAGLSLLLGLIVGAVPFVVIGIKRQRRFLRFEDLFPDAIDLLARAVRAGHAFTTGLDIIAKEMPAPVSDEFRRTFEQQNLGLPLRDAFQNLAQRVPIGDVRIFVTAITIQRETGGNLAEILDNLSKVIRERFKLVRQIKTYTAQGRLSMYLLIAMPPIAGVALFLLNREYIMKLFTDPLGHRFLAGGVILQIVGYFVIRRIIQPRF